MREQNRTNDIYQAVAAIRKGDVVLVPTETVYGLACDATSIAAVQKIFELKQRPDNVSLPVMVESTDKALSLTENLECADRLLKLGSKFWPGPLTIVVPLGPDSQLLPFRKQSSIGIRCPGHNLLLKLLAETGPLAVTSANLHGAKPVETPEEARAIFNNQITYIDGGRCQGKPSTVVSVLNKEPILLREGPISLGEIKSAMREN